MDEDRCAREILQPLMTRAFRRPAKATDLDPVMDFYRQAREADGFEAGIEAAFTLFGYYADMIAERRRRPTDDLTSALLVAEIDGDRLSDQELNMFFVTLVVAGNETTRNLIAHSMLALLEHPEVKQQLVDGIDDDELWASATEEFLRWGASIHNFRRTATVDTEIAGQQIKAGDKVVIYYPSANRDPDHFTDPDVFDPRRTPNDHVTFGGGGPPPAGAAVGAGRDASRTAFSLRAISASIAIRSLTMPPMPAITVPTASPLMIFSPVDLVIMPARFAASAENGLTSSGFAFQCGLRVKSEMRLKTLAMPCSTCPCMASAQPCSSR